MWLHNPSSFFGCLNPDLYWTPVGKGWGLGGIGGTSVFFAISVQVCHNCGGGDGEGHTVETTGGTFNRGFGVFCQSLPVIVGVVVVAATAIMAKIFLFGKKKKQPPITLKDSTVKYPLQLVDREVCSFHFWTVFCQSISQSVSVLYGYIFLYSVDIRYKSWAKSAGR